MNKPGNSFAAIVSLVLLCGPIVLSPFLFSMNRSFINEVENRELAAFPRIERASDVLDTARWNELSNWLRERVPFRGDVITAKNWVDMEVLGQRRLGGVDRGDNGWLFLRQSYGEHWQIPGRRVVDALAAMNGFLERNTDAPATFRILVTPDKHTIYPEHLTEDGLRDIGKTALDRQQFETWFANDDDPRILDMHAAMRAETATSGTEVYFRDDTHQNWHGGAVMAETIVESLLPGTWNDEHVFLAQSIAYDGDLQRLCGVSTLPPREKQVLSVARPGVVPEKIHFEGETYTDFTEIDKNPHSWQYPVRAEFRSDEGLPLVPGRTLVLHDSCIGSIARPLIRPYFEDVQFVHYTDASPEYLDQAMNDYDTVVLEVVERIAPETFVGLLAAPDPNAPSLLWEHPSAETAWSLDDLQSSSLEPRDGVTATIDNGMIQLASERPWAGVTMKGLSLPANQQHVIRVVYRTPLAGEAAVQWTNGDQPFTPNRRAALTIRGGRNDIFLPLPAGEPIDAILFEPGGGAGDYTIESFEIRRVSPVTDQ
ncbi:MAG: hypothetical protein MK116_08860 [Phycisphaerales bacterium]|nr:hypothetical protein [Phycisphaerales bacterium]